MATFGAVDTSQILNGSIPALLWRLALPNVTAVALMTAVTFADAWYVGRIGTIALASLALVFPLLTLMQMMAGGAIGGGVTSAVARAMGAGANERAERIVWHALIIALALAALFTIILAGFARPIFALLGGTGEVLEGAVSYARLVFGGAAATWLLYVVSAILRGLGDTTTPARAIVCASVAQIILSGVLTIGWFGVPSIGIAGPAVAIVLCQSFAVVYLLRFLLYGHAKVRLRPHAISWAPVYDIMKVGGLGLINSTCMAMNVVVVTSLVGGYGTQALAGYGLGARLELMLVPIAFGIGAALTAAVGTNVGAGQFARARRIAWIGAGLTFCATGLLGVGCALIPGLWLDFFTADEGAYQFGMVYLMIAAPFYGIFGAGQALYFASQGTGRMVLPVAVTVFRFVVVASLGLVAIELAWGVEALFAAAAVGLTIMGVGQAACLFAAGWRGR